MISSRASPELRQLKTRMVTLLTNILRYVRHVKDNKIVYDIKE
jgi:hypothetical protein